MKEMIMDFSKQQREHPLIHIDGTAVEKVEIFLGLHITNKLKWSTHTDSELKKTQQRLFNFRRLKKFGLTPRTLTNFFRCTIGSFLSSCITAWYGNCSAHNHKALQGVVRSAQRITGGKLPVPSWTPTAPDAIGRPKRSPRTTTTRATAYSPCYQKAMSVQVHQGRETAKQPSLAHQRLLPIDID
jgi:hypothetical protein